MSKKALTIVALFLFASVLVFVGCSNHDMHNDSGEMNMGGTMRMEGTMNKVNSAEALYDCPMHPEVISAEADTPCPLCNMKLNKMSNEEVRELHSSHLKGCPMHPIVVKGDSKTANCPVCNMKLRTI
ncbi:MAG: hypothetical protein HQ568_06535 [Calditrichaeota bacterium]|nr:hypothetical protein [Calditrichota bacterium]